MTIDQIRQRREHEIEVRTWYFERTGRMTEINKIKAVSKATRDDSPWRAWPAEMMKKTALRRLAKLLPSGRELFEEEDELPPPREEPAATDQRPPGAGLRSNW